MHVCTYTYMYSVYVCLMLHAYMSKELGIVEYFKLCSSQLSLCLYYRIVRYSSWRLLPWNSALLRIIRELCMPCFLLYMYMCMYVAKVLVKRGRPCNCSGISSKRGGKIPIIAYGITCTCSLPSVFDIFFICVYLFLCGWTSHRYVYIQYTCACTCAMYMYVVA